MTKYIDIVFDGPPSHVSGRFVEVEDDQGASISVGEWVETPCAHTSHGWVDWRLRIPNPINALAERIHEISTGKGFKRPDLENLPEKLMLSVSELAEALEEHRSGKPLVYYKCPECGAERAQRPAEHNRHDTDQDGIVCLVGPERFKPEGILTEIGDSVIRNLHMMHSLIEGTNSPYTVEEALTIKVDFNDTRPVMHGGRAY